MKKRRFLSLALSLALAMTMTLPALAHEDTDPPLWEQWGYSSLEEALKDHGEESYYSIVDGALAVQASYQAWMDAHPEECAAFDPYAYYDKRYDQSGGTAQEYMEYHNMSPEEFNQYFLERFVFQQLFKEETQREKDEAIAAFPQEYAAFEPYAYYEENYTTYRETAQEYMDWFGYTEEEFQDAMLASWVSDMQSALYIIQRKADEKLAAGGSVDGINVMLNGTCIPFPDAEPETVNDRTMVPLAAAMEYLGAEITYTAAAHTVTVTMDGQSFTHAIGTDTLQLFDGQEIAMDVSSYTQEGRTMVPIAFFAQYLGYEVFWDEDYECVVLLDREGAADVVNGAFTLINRMLYAMSGAGAAQDGQSIDSALEIDATVTVFDSIQGDKSYFMSLDGNTISDGLNSSGSYSANGKGLGNMMLNEDGFYLSAERKKLLTDSLSSLSKLSMETIWDGESQSFYLSCPVLDRLGLTEAAYDLLADPMKALGLWVAGNPLTVGDVLVANAFDDPYEPFSAWDDYMFSCETVAQLVGDQCFTRSGSSYTTTRSIEPYDLAFFDISYLFNGYIAVPVTATITLTPSGDKSCTYSLDVDMTGWYEAFTLDVSGSPANTDLAMELHIKNARKVNLDLSMDMTATDAEPITISSADEVMESYPDPAA